MPLVQLKAIKKQYHTKTALRDVTLDIESATAVTVFGPNGAVKTTLLKIMSGIMAPTEGRVLYNGSSDSARALRRDTFYLGHKNSLYNGLTVMENLNFFSKLFGRKRDGNIEEVLRGHGLWERRLDPVGELSQGMKRRLALVRGFITGQALIILDEPFVGLDMKWRASVLQKIDGLKRQGRTLVVSTHLVDEGYALADSIVYMHKGRIEFIKDKEQVSLEEIRGLFCSDAELACHSS